MVKQYMIEHDMSEHENDYIKLKLTPSGKYKAADIDSVDDALCDIKKTINNKKVNDVNYIISKNDLIDNKIVVIKKGKKNYFIGKFN